MATSGSAPKGYAVLPEQASAVEWMIAREGASNGGANGGILADECGVGKTVIAVALARDAPLWPLMIVVPKSTLTQWCDVIHSVLMTLHKRQRWVIVSCKTSVHDGLWGGADVMLTTHSSVVQPWAAALFEKPWGRIIVDEAHELRNKHTRLHKVLANARAHAKWALTATPIHNRPADLLALAAFIGVPTTDVEFVRSEYMCRRTADDIAGLADSLPPLTVKNVSIAMACDEERELYDEAMAIFTTRDGRGAETEDDAMAAAKHGDVRAMERLMRCRQACTHPAIYYKSMAQKTESPEYARLAAEARAAPEGRSSKLTFLCQDIEDHADERALVFCEWRVEMEVIRAMLEGRGVACLQVDGSQDLSQRVQALKCFDREAADDDRAGTPRVMLIQIKCGTCGVNLQAASRVYLVSPHWNPAVERQAIGRAHRRGQTRAVTVLRLVAVDTVDEAVVRLMESKVSAIEAALHDDAMRKVIMPTVEASGSDGTSAAAGDGVDADDPAS